MVLAAPGPLLTPPPSSSPPKTPYRSYSAQTNAHCLGYGGEQSTPIPGDEYAIYAIAYMYKCREQ
jgi:hypothetical protein